MTSRLLYWLSAVFYMVFIFFLSSQPKLPLPYEFTGADKILHIALYAPMGFLISCALTRSELRTNVLLYASLLSFLYGLSDEFHQGWVPGRDASPFDLIANGIGAFIGSYVYTKLR